jgi:transcription elongation GreA/GreB family factor
MEAVEDPEQRSLLADVLISENQPPTADIVASSVTLHEKQLIERELREIRVRMAEVQAKDDLTETLRFADRKMALDKRLAQINKITGNSKVLFPDANSRRFT